MIFFRSFCFVLFIVLTACSNLNQQNEESRWETHAANTEIIRDDFGVPHIYGKTDADAVFGLLYAQCEDDFNRVERNYIWATGRLAEVEGENALYSDLRAKLFMTEDEALELYKNSPKWLKELCIAFADGINYYLYTHPEVQPKLLTHFEPWMPMYFSEGSIGGDIERVSTRRIQAFYKENNQQAFSTPDDGLIRPEDNEPRGSNGIAISGKLSKSGKTMLLINPHTSFFFRGEVHMISEEGLNAYGAVTWGQFFIYQGFNEKTGWMHTSTATDVTDEFIETIVETADGKKYKYGENLRSVDSLTVSIKYKAETGFEHKDFMIFRTHHGPVTHKIDNKWVSTAMMWDPVNALIQSYTRTKLSGHKEFYKMMDIRTNSSNNTVYADAEGNIAYYHGNFIPRRDTSFNYRRPVDGSDPETDWQGLHTVDEAITVINPPNGWIQNCNSTPFTCSADYSPKKEDYPDYMARSGENFRGIHAIRLLEKAKDLTLDKLIELAYDPYIPALEWIIPGLIKAYDETSNPDQSLKEPIEILRKWDFAVSKESVGMSLARYYYTLYSREGKRPAGMGSIDRVKYFGNDSPYNERLGIFKKTIVWLEGDFGSWNTPWGEINRYQRINGDIRQEFNDDKPSIGVGMASGSLGALASYGARSYKGSKRLYGTSGNSFVAVVEFGDKVKAKSMLAGGQSGDPDSPHFDDQAQRYADIKFKDVAYYREDVEKRAKAVYQPGEKK